MTSLRVLLLEDIALDAELITAALDGAGLDVEVRRVDGKRAYLTALDEEDALDAILADFSLPGFDGFEAMAAAESRRHGVPFIFVTGAVGDERAVEMLKRGATDVVFKSRLERLAPSLRRAVEETRERNDRKRAEAHLRLLADVSRDAAASLDERVIVRTIVARCVPGFADWSVIDILVNGQLERWAGAHRDPAILDDIMNIRRNFPVRRDDAHVSARVLREGTTFLTSPGENAMESSFSGDAHRAMGHRIGMESLLVVPLIIHGEALGVWMFAQGSGARRYGPADVALAEELGRRAAVSVENARLYKRAGESVAQREHLLHVVNHDVRNPLSAIQLAVAVLKRKFPEGASDVARQLDVVDRAAQRIAGLLTNSLGALGSVVDQRAPQPLEALLEEAEVLHRPLAEARGIALEVTPPPPGVRVMADRDSLHQALGNVLGNAIKFTEHGSVRVTTETAREGVLLSVSDTGPGIPEESRDHVFERGWQGGKRAGSGLGLYIARGIVEAHGGRIWVESQVGVGTTVRIQLPVTTEISAASP